MPPMTIAIDDLPCLQDEAALFGAAGDPGSVDMAVDQIIISIITNQ